MIAKLNGRKAILNQVILRSVKAKAKAKSKSENQKAFSGREVGSFICFSRRMSTKRGNVLCAGDARCNEVSSGD